MARIVSLLEHEVLGIDAHAASHGGKGITERDADALDVLGERIGVRMFERRYRGFRFSQFCGVIQVADLTIEVLPKISGGPSALALNRSLLVKMLAAVGDLPLSEAGLAKLRVESHDLLTVFIDYYCRELAKELLRGPMRGYVAVEENRSVLRGRFVAPEHMRRNIGHDERVCCEFDELTIDNGYNRALRAALKAVRHGARADLGLVKRVNQLIWTLDEVADVSVSAAAVRQLPRNRLVARWEPLLKMAEWFLGSKSPDLRAGRYDALALVFDMNHLFQRFVTRMLPRALPRGINLRAEAPRHFMVREAPKGTPQLRLKPDICLIEANTGVPLAIIDTKWKLLDPPGRGRTWDVPPSDVYQMLAYARTYECPHVALVYPQHQNLVGVATPQFEFLRRDGSPAKDRLALHFANLGALAKSTTSHADVQSIFGPLLSAVGFGADGATHARPVAA